LLKTYLKIIFCLICIGSANASSDYSRPINWSGNIYRIINGYNKVHKNFFAKVCKPDDAVTYKRLIRQYRGQGYYLPTLNNDIDRRAIIKNLHHYKKKVKFIEKTILKLKKLKEFPVFSLVALDLNKTVDSLLNLKKQYHQAIRGDKKKKIQTESKHQLVLLKKQFDVFVDQLFFMKSYNFPNDYLANRALYEQFKDLEGLSNKRRANEIFFYRKVTEDGAYDPNNVRGDKFIRTALDTLYLKINSEKDFLAENVRYDFDWIKRHVEKITERGKKVQLSRLTEWKRRTLSNFNFHQELVAIKNKKQGKFLVKKESDASTKLKNFIYRKQGEAYNFWAKQSELHKAMFSLETILVHEVGVIDGTFGLERVSVGKVVLNRYHDDFYNQLEDDQPIVRYIDKKIDTSEEKWLNVLFKIGEFSFTYHYIPAVAGIHCPDMSRRGKNIRNKNLKIALQTMKRHDGSFVAFRYFSRISMMGKIDMSTVWTDYDRLPEIPGYESSDQIKLMRYYHADKYQYLYSFSDARGAEHQVVKIRKKVYSVRWIKGVPVFFDYRNPHLFAYFSKKNQ